MAEAKRNVHQGHRQKVRDRYYETGLTGMPDHNILEFLLFFGIPQRDTNEMAHELIDRFGSFSGVLEAKKADLLDVKGMTETAACLLTLFLPVYKRYVEDLHKKRPVLATKKDYIKYLRHLYLDSPNNERIYILCFDSNNRLVACRKISEGDFSSALFDIRKIASAVLEVNAKKIVLSHNHPNGMLEPSREDCSITAELRDLLSLLKVKFVDHVIITDTNHFSMCSSGRYTHLINGGEPLI
ncbi:MAG: hypothetical protein IJC79_03745 [Clostridia bacterium]|nr:hypothetical protein [Clostridia bacterium]